MGPLRLRVAGGGGWRRLPVADAPTPRQRWEALKERGGYAVAEIDRDTPWAHTEPAWWLEMMDARRAQEVSNATG